MTRVRIPGLATAALFLVALMPAPAAMAQAGGGAEARRAGVVTAGGTLLRQADADLDGGGSYSVTSVLLRTGWMTRAGRRALAGVSIDIDGYDFDFDDPAAFGGVSPWERVQHLGLGIPVLLPRRDGWTLFATPTLGLFRETGADADESVAWGVVAGGVYTFEPGRRIGIGLGVFDRLEETRAFPFVSVNWELTERLTLGNPLRAGPTGPAGLELAYDVGSGWKLGGGFAYRSLRFRLDDDGPAPGGIGEQRGTPVFLRASRGLGRRWQLDLYAGRTVNPELRLEDEAGRRLVTEEHDDAGFLAATLRGLF